MSSSDREQQPQQIQAPILCRKNCGFYGNPVTGLCSKCQKTEDEKNSRRQPTAEILSTPTAVNMGMATRSSPIAIPGRTGGGGDGVSVDTIPSSAPAEMMIFGEGNPSSALNVTRMDPLPPSPLGNSMLSESTSPKSSFNSLDIRGRCFTCRKKLGLTGFQCKCGNYYCAMHRYSDKHDCDYDYKKAGRENLSKDNPAVISDKIVKI